MLLSFCTSMLLCFRAFVLPCFRASVLLCYRASVFLWLLWLLIIACQTGFMLYFPGYYAHYQDFTCARSPLTLTPILWTMWPRQGFTPKLELSSEDSNIIVIQEVINFGCWVPCTVVALVALCTLVLVDGSRHYLVYLTYFLVSPESVLANNKLFFGNTGISRGAHVDFCLNGHFPRVNGGFIYIEIVQSLSLPFT